MSTSSKIDRLPEPIRERLDDLVQKPGVTQTEKAERINQMAEASGHEEALTRHDVGRYERRMKEVGQRLKESRQVADVWAEKLGANHQGKLGKLTNELLRTLTFDLSMKMSEMEMTDEVIPSVIKVLDKLALIQQRVERSHEINMDAEEKIKKRAREAALREAADRMEGAAEARGLSKEDARFWREQVLMGL